MNTLQQNTKKGETMKPMKKIALGLAGIAFIATMNAQDDVYYTPSNRPAPTSSGDNHHYSDQQQQPAQNTAPTQSNSNVDYYTPPANQNRTDSSSTSSVKNGNTYVTNNYYNQDDYYDYAYSSRIRRFHNPVYSCGYYDPFYTNTYFYSYNPYQYGMSIYMGYNWWGPSYYSYAYSPSIYWGFGPQMGWGMGFGYGGYYNPYSYYGYGFGGGYGYGGYNHGYYNGYMNGYYNGLASNGYYNSYDPNSYYGSRGTYHYGSRNTGSGRNTGSTNGKQQQVAPVRSSNFADTYTVAAPRVENNINSASGNKGVDNAMGGKENNFTQTPAPVRTSSFTNTVKNESRPGNAGGYSRPTNGFNNPGTETPSVGSRPVPVNSGNGTSGTNGGYNRSDNNFSTSPGTSSPKTAEPAARPSRWTSNNDDIYYSPKNNPMPKGEGSGRTNRPEPNVGSTPNSNAGYSAPKQVPSVQSTPSPQQYNKSATEQPSRNYNQTPSYQQTPTYQAPSNNSGSWGGGGGRSSGGGGGSWGGGGGGGHSSGGGGGGGRRH